MKIRLLFTVSSICWYQIMILQVLVIWFSPASVEAALIFNICVFASLEGIFAIYEQLAVSINRKVAFCLFIPFFVACYASLSLSVQSDIIIYGYFAAVATRAINAFLDSRDESENLIYLPMYGLIGFYFLAVFIFVYLFKSFIPELGLNNGFLQASGYFDLTQEIGALVSNPKLAFAFIVIYFSGLCIQEILKLRLISFKR